MVPVQTLSPGSRSPVYDLRLSSRATVVPAARVIRSFPLGEGEPLHGKTSMHRQPAAQGLYDPRFEHDACGVSFVVHMKGLRSHTIVQHGIGALCALEHRGASGSEVNT